ncbi:THAP9 [Branchiostoma lanceolatum]|uniref:THAP9 protein n=2 Tax=Branchiostoma lanceolatum TaxID=7740 RepID=A0A8K0ERR9_BRALA|nr:THAP9 [Branchiostoma lanceolatum]
MDHKGNLARVCRVCGTRFKPPKDRKPKPVTAFRETILYLFDGFDIIHDKEDTHPPFVCEKCRLTLIKAQAKLKDGKGATTMLGDKMADFHPHTEDTCTICNYRPTGRPIKKTPPGLRAPSTAVPPENGSTFDTLTDGEIIDEATRHGFAHLGSAGNGDLVFAKYQVKSVHVKIQQQVNVKQDRTWEVFVHDKPLPPSHPIYSSRSLPSVLTKDTKSELFLELKESSICVGNLGYDELLKKKREGVENVVFKGVDGNVVAREETGPHTDDRTIRHVDCHLLLPSNKFSPRCPTCTAHGNTLRGALHRTRHKKDLDVSHSSRVSNKHLTKEQLIDKSKDLQREKRLQKTLASKAKDRVCDAVEKEGCNVNENQHVFLQSVLKAAKPKPGMQFEDGSAQQFLFQQQVKQSQQQDARTMRWHPMMIRWCLAIFYTSNAAYDIMRNSGFLQLPHRTTLQQYGKFTEPTPGFNPDILTKLGEVSNLINLPDWKKNVTLVWDEMKIKSGLVFCKSSGDLIGFTDLGEINNEMKDFERRCREQQHGTDEQPDLATHVLALMVRGIFTNLEFVFGYYPCLGFSSDQLYPAIWDGTAILEDMGFHVRAFVSDGASPNRRFYKIHGDDDAQLVYWTTNNHRPGHKIYFISDVPHLVKTTRNNLENSGANRRTRNLHYDGQEITWRHIVSVYEWDLDPQRVALGMRKLIKLKTDHVHLTPSLRMRVNLAAQVLSNTMSCTLASQGRHDTEGTRKFIGMMDRFFDCLNVKSARQGDRTRKDDLKPYRDVEDARFTWLEKEFLGYLHRWEQQAQQTPGVTKDVKNRMCLSKQTLVGLRMTVLSFIELTKTLLQEEGVTYVLSDKFNQPRPPRAAFFQAEETLWS